MAREIGGKSGIGRTETAHGRYEAAAVLVLNEKHELSKCDEFLFSNQ